jgi:hypothetical protein
MKGAREKAIDVMSRRYFPVPGNSERSIATHDIEGIESAGLRIVDASLFQALVEAVRARQWTEACRGKWRESFLALLSDEDYLGDEIDRSGDVAEAAHARAVELLERGE